MAPVVPGHRAIGLSALEEPARLGMAPIVGTGSTVRGLVTLAADSPHVIVMSVAGTTEHGTTDLPVRIAVVETATIVLAAAKAAMIVHRVGAPAVRAGQTAVVPALGEGLVRPVTAGTRERIVGVRHTGAITHPVAAPLAVRVNLAAVVVTGPTNEAVTPGRTVVRAVMVIDRPAVLVPELAASRRAVIATHVVAMSVVATAATVAVMVIRIAAHAVTVTDRQVDLAVSRPGVSAKTVAGIAASAVAKGIGLVLATEGVPVRSAVTPVVGATPMRCEKHLAQVSRPRRMSRRPQRTSMNRCCPWRFAPSSSRCLRNLRTRLGRT